MRDSGDDDGERYGSGSTNLPDPHGEAALLLIESLIHGLLARSDLSNSEALDIVQTAVEIQAEISEDRGDDLSAGPLSLRLLRAIAASLSADDPQKDGGSSDATDR